MNNEERILAILESMQSDISGLKEDVSGLKEDVSGLKEDVGGLKEDVSGLKKDVSGLKEDVGGLKEDVGGLKEDVGGLKGELLKTNIRIENEIVPKINMLCEGMTSLQETAAKKKDVSEELDELRADITMMKRLYMKLNA